uniref:Chalcone isomerase domain-containing protein n=1 Tax=Amphora coffeiformis TaxID=265554 RepID=A0A7S3L7L1_9STRA|mmetsp:Transcript_9822/g.18822  ORF Transcript_9822/g.18822 Transcript_9822/m.18822 type:complete len:254 (-) Transcript_9822:46-807(-)
MLSTLRSSRMITCVARFRPLTTLSRTAAASSTSRLATTVVLIGAGAAAAYVTSTTPAQRAYMAASMPLGGDIISAGKPVKEKATGILFPALCNGYYFAGCGVRIKYGFVKVYALGTYLDPLAMSAVKKADAATIQEALCNPTYPRTIRIVMNRGLSMQKFTDAIIEALEPRMKGKDLEKLEEFKALNPPLDLVKGAEIEITIRGDILLYKNAVGGVGTIRSEVFTAAMCDTFYGDDAVSPTHKADVLAGVPKL